MTNGKKNKTAAPAVPAAPSEASEAVEVKAVPEAVTAESFAPHGAPRKVGITDTSLRDGHQSLMATRMSISDMTPIAEMMDEGGFHSMEVWGGATFDTCMRFLDEDPWERLRTLRKLFKKTSSRCSSGGRTWWATATTPTTPSGSS